MASPNDNIRADASIGSGPNDSFDFYLEADDPAKSQAEADTGSNPEDPANNSESSVYLWLLGESLTEEQKQQAVAMERELPASVKKLSSMGGQSSITMSEAGGGNYGGTTYMGVDCNTAHMSEANDDLDWQCTDDDEGCEVPDDW